MAGIVENTTGLNIRIFSYKNLKQPCLSARFFILKVLNVSFHVIQVELQGQTKDSSLAKNDFVVTDVVTQNNSVSKWCNF